MSRKVTIPVEFELGTLDEIGLGGFKQTWLSATDEGRDYELTSGAGVGSPYLEGSVRAESAIRLRQSRHQESRPETVRGTDRRAGQYAG